MGYLQSMRLYFSRYFDFQGRSTKPEYWWPILTYFVVILLLVSAIIPGFAVSESSDDSVLTLFLLGVLIIWILANIIPGIAVTVRRLHDINQTGWIYLGVVVVSFVFGLVQLVATIVIGVLDGSEGDNKYGPDPRDPTRSFSDIFS